MNLVDCPTAQWSPHWSSGNRPARYQHCSMRHSRTSRPSLRKDGLHSRTIRVRAVVSRVHSEGPALHTIETASSCFVAIQRHTT